MYLLLLRKLLTVSFFYIASTILMSKSYAEEDYIPIWHSDTYVPSAASLGLSQIKILPDGSMLLRSAFGLYKRKNLNSPWKITLIEWSPAIVEIKSIDNIKYQLYAHVDKGD
jgi:hypothetical protein